MISPPKTEFKKDSHCSWCGNKYSEQIKYPRKCFVCYNEIKLKELEHGQ